MSRRIWHAATEQGLFLSQTEQALHDAYQHAASRAAAYGNDCAHERMTEAGQKEITLLPFVYTTSNEHAVLSKS